MKKHHLLLKLETSGNYASILFLLYYKMSYWIKLKIFARLACLCD